MPATRMTTIIKSYLFSDHKQLTMITQLVETKDRRLLPLSMVQSMPTGLWVCIYIYGNPNPKQEQPEEAGSSLKINAKCLHYATRDRICAKLDQCQGLAYFYIHTYAARRESTQQEGVTISHKAGSVLCVCVCVCRPFG